MADIETSIGIGIDTSNALAAIKNLQREISAFHSTLAKGSANAANASASLQKDLINNLNATGQFSASMTTVRSTTESFTAALEKNKLSMGEYFRYAGGASKSFGKLFTKEFDTIEKVARERVKDLQSQYIQLGRDANGALKAIKVRPLVLDMEDLGTKTQIAAQKQQIFNQLLKQGSTNLLNFGKNTQWAGRQLMVGFTLPMTVFASTAAKTFMELEKQAIRFKRVYGDLFTTPEDADKMVKSLQELSLEFTKYGVAVEKTMGLAADAAAMGKTGVDLLSQVTEANRLAVLGNVEQAQALETTISVTNAFGVATDKLASKIDFLNAVENQTVTSIEDLTIAIPKAGPVVQQLGGDVEDLAYFLTAMKEGGINASEGANALKSGLASLINPTAKASDFLQGFGINIQNIVNANKGDVKGLVTDFAKALDTLDPLNRAQAIEQLFGKFQFSRLSTLFQNVIAEGTQAERVLALSNSTVKELAALSEKELGNVANSTTYKFQKAVEELRAAIAPVGEQFLKAITPVLEFAAEILNKFNSLSDGVKNFVVIGGALLAGLGPVFLMTFGLIANGVANIIKGFAAVRGLFLKTKDSSSILGEQIGYMTQEQLDAAAVASSLERVHEKLEQRFTSEAGAINNLVAAYEKAIRAQGAFSGVPGVRGAAAGGMKLASGIVSVPGPKGAGDIVPAVLSPGEAVIPAKAAQKYAPIIQGMIAGNLPGYEDGVMLGMPRSGKSTGKNRDAAQQIYEMFLQSNYRDVPPTNYGHQLSPTSGHSFPIFGLGGVYMGPGGQKVFVKPVMDEKAALAEMRATQIARQAHGLKAPEQRIVVIRDPQDPTRQRRFLALESALDSTFINNDPMAVFNEGQYFKQLVASLLRADKDLSASNVFGDVVADVGPAGVFSRASGLRDYATDLPSMEQQAMINLLGIKGGAKRAFAESTLGLMAGLTPQQYHQRMIAEIQAVLPALKQTVAGFGLTDPAEADVYLAMIQRLEQGLTVDWSKFHAIHSAVKPKQSTPAIPGYADGVVSVPGPKGAGDVQPAMLSPGEAVIPADKARKYASLIQAMIYGKIPGYENSNVKKQTSGASGVNVDVAIASLRKLYAKHIEVVPEFGDALDELVRELAGSAKGIKDLKEKIKLEVGSLANIIKTTESFNRDRGPSGQSAWGVNATHGNARMVLSPEDARLVGDEMQRRGFVGGTAQALSSATKSVDAFSNLVFPMPRSFNMGDMTGEDGASWIREDKQRFMSLIAQNTGLDPSDPGAIQFAENVADALERAGATAVSESMFEEIIAEQLGLLAEGAAKRALTEARDTYTTFNVVRPGSESGNPHRQPSQVGVGVNAAGEVVSTAQQSFRGSAARKLTSSFDQDADVFVNSLVDKFISAVKRGLRINSPSEEYQEITQGVTEGVRAGADDAQQAGRVIGETITDTAAASVQSQAPTVYKLPGLRRVTTDINVYQREMEAFSRKQQAVFDKIKAQHAMLGEGIKNSLRVPAGVSFDRNTRQEIVPPSTSMSFEKLNSMAMQASFAFSSLASVTSMFGAEMGAINEAIYGISNAMFLLTTVTNLVTQAKGAEIKQIYLAVAAQIANTIETVKNTAAKAASTLQEAFSGGFVSGLKSIGGLFSKAFSKISGFITKLGGTSLMLGRLIPIVGAVVTAFSLFKLFADMQESQKQKIEGLGNAAFAAGDKLKFLAEAAGFTPTRDPGSRYEESNVPSEGLTATEKSTAVGLTKDENFQKELKNEDGYEGKFYKDVENLKKATLADAEVSLQALYANLLAVAPEGTDASVVKATVAAIAAAAGQEDVSLELGVTLNPFNPGNEKNVLQYVKSVQENVPDIEIVGGSAVAGSADKVAAGGRAAGSATTAGIEQLNTQFEAGLLTSSQYRINVGLLLDGIAALDAVAQEAAITQMFENYGVPKETFSSIKQLEDQMLLLKALASGADIDPQIWKDITLDDDPNASAENKKKAAEAEKDLAKAISDANDKTSQSYIEKKNAQIQAQAAQDTAINDTELERLQSIQEELGGVTEALGSEAQAYKFLQDEKWRNLLLDAQLKDQQAGGGTANVDALMESYKELNAVQAEVNFGAALADLREDAALKKDLEANGYSAAEATAILNDEMLEQARINAIANGTLDEFNKQLAEYVDLSGKDTPAGGTPDKTPYEEATESLKKQRTELLNTANTYAKLRKAGVDIGKAFKIAKDPILAAALASEKVGTKKWKELLGLINQVNSQELAAELKEITNTNFVDAKTTKNTEFLEKSFKKMGYNALEIEKIMEQIGDNPDLVQKFANDLKDGKVDAESIKNYLGSIKNLKIKVSLEDMEADVSEAFSDIAEGISAQRQQIDIDFEFGTNESGKNKIDPLTGLPFNTKDINKRIKEAEDYIAERNYQIDDYEYQLDGIQEQEDKINEAYDARIEALEEVQKINEQISEGQKGQLDLADALSRGDIAAAAKAAQEIAATDVNNAYENQKDALEKAREADLGSVRSANGMSRVEIETKIRDLKKEIAEKEEDVLEPQQRSLDLAEGYRDAANQAVEYLGKNEDEWKKVEAGVKLARTEAEGYKKAIEDAIALIPQLREAYSTTSTQSDANPNQAKIDELNRLRKISRENIKNSSDAAYRARLTDLNIQRGKEIKSLGGVALASGGFVSGPGTPTSDSIPAWLSNGEYVIKASAVKNLGVGFLDAINNNRFANGGLVNAYDGSAAANARAAQSKDLLAKQLAREEHLRKLKQNPYYDKKQTAIVEAQIARMQAARQKLADPVFTPGSTNWNSTVRNLRTTANSGTNINTERANRDANKNARAQSSLEKILADRKASRLRMLAGATWMGSSNGWRQTMSDAAAKYQREQYYNAPPRVPGMSGNYKFDPSTGTWKPKFADGGKVEDFNNRLANAQERLRKLMQNPYYDKGRAAIIEAQVNRTKAALHKMSDPTNQKLADRLKILMGSDGSLAASAQRKFYGVKPATTQGPATQSPTITPSTTTTRGSTSTQSPSVSTQRPTMRGTYVPDGRGGWTFKPGIRPSTPSFVRGSFKGSLGNLLNLTPRGTKFPGLGRPKYFNDGGLARGTDTVPAMLTPGEFVMSRSAVRSYGTEMLSQINSGAFELPKLSMPEFSMTSPNKTPEVDSRANNNIHMGNSVYNSYELNVNVRSDSNPDEIARTVMSQIRQINSQQMRGSRF